MTSFEKIKKEIEVIFNGYQNGKELPHAQGTLNWVLTIKPDAGDVMKIAAFAHDIERCVNPNKVKSDMLVAEDLSKYRILKRQHAQIGAEAVVKILEKYGVDEQEINRVRYLIENHEDGGDEEANVLRDADSLSYLEDNFDNYFKKYGADRATAKVKYMLDRMTEDRKPLGLKIYQENLKKLNNYK